MSPPQHFFDVTIIFFYRVEEGKVKKIGFRLGEGVQCVLKDWFNVC